MDVMDGFYKYTDLELAIELQQGSSVAFKQILDRYKDKLFYYILAIVKCESVGEDIVQETFIRLWINREKFDPDKSLSGYLHIIARNLSLNHLKRAAYDQELKQHIWQKIEVFQERSTTHENIYAMESKRLVEQAVERLSPNRKRVFQLSRDHGMTHQEISIKLGVSKNTVKNQIVSALKEIRTYLNKHSDIALGWGILVILLRF
jgi:RNA polymerase sigma-70 factor (family 1)